MMSKFGFAAAVALVGTVWAENGDEGLVREKDYNAWHFRIGPVMSPRVRVNVRGPRFALPAMPKPKSGTGVVAPVDPSEKEFANRQYVDGHVNPDGGTADPRSLDYGVTWDWSAKNVPEQYSAADETISFHTDVTRWNETVSAESFSSGSNSDSDRDFLIGVEAFGGWTFYDDRTFDAAVDAGFRFYGSGNIDAASRYGTTYTTTRNEWRVVDTYDASGWGNDIPAGVHEWTGDDADRCIGATPTRDEQQKTTTSSETHYYSGGTKLNYRIWDLRLGPTVGWHVTDWFALRGGVYGLLGLVDASLKTSADTSAGPMGASASTCGAVFGMAFGLSAQVNITESLFVYGGAEYDWWTDSVDLNAGGANAEIKLSDLVVSLGVGVGF